MLLITLVGCDAMKQNILPHFSLPLYQYTQVCRRMRGYQKGSTDSFRVLQGSSIYGPYVNGVGITQGSPRQCTCTSAIKVSKNFNDVFIMLTYVPVFLLAPNLLLPLLEVTIFVSLDVLVTGIRQPSMRLIPYGMEKGVALLKQCAVQLLVCHGSTRSLLDAPTTDYIEVRVYSDQLTWDENILISSYEIYVL